MIDLDEMEPGELYAFKMEEGKGLFPNAHLNYEQFVGRVMGPWEAGKGFPIDLEEDDVYEQPILVLPENVKSCTHVASHVSGFLFQNGGSVVNLVVKTGKIPVPMIGKIMSWNSHPEEISFFGSFTPHGAVLIPVGQILEAELNPLFD